MLNNDHFALNVKIQLFNHPSVKSSQRCVQCVRTSLLSSSLTTEVTFPRRGPGPALTGTALVALGLGKKRQVVKTLRHSGTMTPQLPAPNMSSD